MIFLVRESFVFLATTDAIILYYYKRMQFMLRNFVHFPYFGAENLSAVVWRFVMYGKLAS